MRPRVTVNCAASADGKIATVSRKQTRLSSSVDMARVIALRAASDAIMVGVGTVIADDPSLTAKGASKNPMRVIVDSKGRSPWSSKIFDGKAKTIVATAAASDATFPNAEVVRSGESNVDLSALLDELGRRGVKSLLVEGGGTLVFSLLEAGLVDELMVYVADVILGGTSAPTLADGPGFPSLDVATRLDFVSVRRDAGGVLLHYRVRRGP